MTGDIISFVFLTFLVVLLTVGVVRAVVLPGRYEAIVRDWARENGYAILTIERRGRNSDYGLIPLLGWFVLIVGLFITFGSYGFTLLIQDEQGDPITVTVFVSKPGKPVEVHWEYEPPFRPRAF